MAALAAAAFRAARAVGGAGRAGSGAGQHRPPRQACPVGSLGSSSGTVRTDLRWTLSRRDWGPGVTVTVRSGAYSYGESRFKMDRRRGPWLCASVSQRVELC